MQNYENHGHLPVPTAIGAACALVALIGFGLRWLGIWPRAAVALGISGLFAAILVLLAISRLYTTRLQDRIIKLEMRVRAMSVLTPDQQRALFGLSNKQIAALRFASDQEMPALLERAVREHMAPRDIKRAVTSWTPDLDRT